jgi:hypothetical protein
MHRLRHGQLRFSPPMTACGRFATFTFSFEAGASPEAVRKLTGETDSRVSSSISVFQVTL